MTSDIVPSDKPSRNGNLIALAIWVVLILGIGFLLWASFKPAGNVEDCTVTEAQVHPGERRSLSYLEVKSNCGDFISRNIAHRTTIEVGEVYNFKLTGGIVGKPTIVKADRISPLIDIDF